MAVEVEFSQLTWFNKRGQATRNAFYNDLDAALEAAGLSE